MAFAPLEILDHATEWKEFAEAKLKNEQNMQNIQYK